MDEPRYVFSWVHLSDLHFGHGNAEHGFDQKLVLDSLKRDLQLCVTQRRVPAPAAILISGDVAFSGATRSASEYSDARAYLLELAAALQLGPDRVFIVAGNHDVQRSADAEGPVRRLVAALRGGDEALDQVLAVEAEQKLLGRRQAHFAAFAREFAPACLADPQQAQRPDVWVHRLQKDPPVRLIGLNTALLAAGDEDHGKLRVGLGALATTLLTPPVEAGELILALGHHPLRGGWLCNEAEVIGWLQRFGCIYLSGHIHTHETEDAQSGSGRSFVRVSAGAAHAGRGDARHGYNFGAVARGPSDRLLLRVWPRIWTPRSKRFIADRAETLEDQDFAEHELAVAARPAAGSAAGNLVGNPAGNSSGIPTEILTGHSSGNVAKSASGTPSKNPSGSYPSLPGLPQMSELRQVLDQMLAEADVDAFLQDYFPAQHKRLQSTPERAAQLDHLVAHEEPVAIRQALLGRQARQMPFPAPPSTSSAGQNPYYLRLQLTVDHKSYIKRKCDEEFARCLNDKKLLRTVVYGDFGVGKSSLLARADEHSDRQFAHVSLEALNTFDQKDLIRGFWKLLTRAWSWQERGKITDWDNLAPDNPTQRLGILIDEFGRLNSAELALPFIDSLLQYGAKYNIPVVICLPCSLETYFMKIELQNDKWRGGWSKIQVPVFGAGEILTLMAHLPAPAQKLVNARFETLLKRSQRVPRRLQCLLAKVYSAATTEGLLGKQLGDRIHEIMGDEQNYL